MNRALPGAAVAALALAACAAPPPPAVDTVAMLAALRASPPPEGVAAAGTVRIAPLDAAALALRHHPDLRALRARAGVAESRIVEAGLLPDPSIGWDAMDAIAAEWIEGDSGRLEVASGFGLSWPVPRPGEIDGREARARADLDGARARLMTAEWDHAAAVLRTCVELEQARRRAALFAALRPVLARTHEVLDAARGAGEVTRIEERLAANELARLRADQVAATADESRVRRRLASLLGLAPDTPIEVVGAERLIDIPSPLPEPGPLADEAVARRPDLAAHVARHRAAVADLRVAVAGRWPALSVGTGIEVVLPLFSRFNGPAIETARRMEEATRRDVEAAVFHLRAEAHDAVADLRAARERLDLVAGPDLPDLGAVLERAREALAAGQMTVVELLAVHRQHLEAREQGLGALADAAMAWIRCRAVRGDLLVSEPTTASRIHGTEEDR